MPRVMNKQTSDTAIRSSPKHSPPPAVLSCIPVGSEQIEDSGRGLTRFRGPE